MAVSQGIPDISTPLMEPDGNVNLIWYRFFQQLWQTTGVSIGSAKLVGSYIVQLAATTVYTGGSPTYITDNALFVNSTNGPLLVDAWLIPSGGSANSSNHIIVGLVVPANGRVQPPQLLNQGFTAGRFLQLQASGPGITFSMSGHT